MARFGSAIGTDLVIQHNPTPNKASSGLDAKRGKGNAYVTPHRDKQHGRIYRVYPKGSPNDRPVNFEAGDKTKTIAAGLKHSNQFWRLLTQRLCVEQGITVRSRSRDSRVLPQGRHRFAGSRHHQGRADLAGSRAQARRATQRAPR